MGIPVLIYGKSGCGKSTSLRNFAEDEILLAKVVNKPNPFKKKFKFTCASSDVNYIETKLSNMPMNTAVVDDAGYLMTSMFMTFEGNNFDKYDNISKVMWSLFNYISYNTRPDVIVYVIMHEDNDDSGNTKPLTLGRLLDNKVNLPGMCTIVLHAMKVGKNYVFRTQSNGMDIAKSPMDMFELEEMPNDLKEVDKTIREYYGFKA
jgi:hypothetical protein